ncbi:hypothetical protein LTR97_006335 [Elasticomyces elasticus]|uniref:Uncharacterized protein n=1 Tax=Elasticomyces elasticus TaxID=574655 RepID=A0AAN7WAI8_9PEZI|nr:hypothetical protein LTR97_006335 [Elasticomyces elasticus]
MTDTNVIGRSSSAPPVGKKRTAEVAFGRPDPAVDKNPKTTQAPASVRKMSTVRKMSIIYHQPHICLLNARDAFDYIDHHSAFSYMNAHIHMVEPRVEDVEEADRLFEIFISSVDTLSLANQRDPVLSYALSQAKEGLELMCEWDPVKLQWVKAGLRYFAQL